MWEGVLCVCLCSVYYESVWCVCVCVYNNNQQNLRDNDLHEEPRALNSLKVGGRQMYNNIYSYKKASYVTRQMTT